MGTRPRAEPILPELATAESDADAIHRSRVDPEAFVAVFDRHFDTIHRYLHRRLGRDLADELAAEVFTQAYRKRDRFDPRFESALPWLYGIASNLLRRHRRTELRRLRAYARSGVDVWAEIDEGDIDSRLDAARLGAALARALASLSTEDRETLGLVVLGGQSYEETGRALGVPPGTIASRMNRIRGRLSSRLPVDPTEEESS